MRPQQLTALVTLCAAVVLALCLGISIATENYMLLAFVATLVVVGGLVVMPGYVPLLVFSLLMPFSLPIPFIWNFPFLMIGLGICAVKHWLQGGLRQRTLKSGKESDNFQTVTLPLLIFMVWVFFRYCMNPALPNFMGWGTNVTGFRAWLGYFLCFGVLFYTGRLLNNRDGLKSLMRWLAYASAFFVFILVPAALSKSPAVATFFFRLGMYVDNFDNGFLRFVALPEFGVILFTLVLLPNIFPLKRLTRCALACIALGAIVAGGNRSSLGGAFIIACTIPALRGKVLHTLGTVVTLAAIAISGYLLGPQLSQLPHTGFLRPLALFSPDLAQSTGGNDNLEWREVRWQRGLEEIRKHPLIGEGYGGMENALSSDLQSEEENVEMSVATGGVHNGYIACAVALGVPAAVLFVFILIGQIFGNAKRAYNMRKKDPMLADVHCFICAYLLAAAVGTFFAADMNEPVLWFFFGLSIFVRQLRSSESQKLSPKPAFVKPSLPVQFA
jgi:O-antigen ligase